MKNNLTQIGGDSKTKANYWYIL